MVKKLLALRKIYKINWNHWNLRRYNAKSKNIQYQTTGEVCFKIKLKVDANIVPVKFGMRTKFIPPIDCSVQKINKNKNKRLE